MVTLYSISMEDSNFDKFNFEPGHSSVPGNYIYLFILPIQTYYFILRLRAATRWNGSTDVCSKVTSVKSIYLLNVVVKQEIFVKKTENETSDITSCYMQQSSMRYTLTYIDSRTQWYNTQTKICLTYKNIDSDRQQLAQLSQRDRTAGWVNYGQKWKCKWETIFYGHYRGVFNHYDVIGQQSNRIQWKMAKKGYYAAQDYQGRYQLKACMRLPISD